LAVEDDLSVMFGGESRDASETKHNQQSYEQ
jgi:hypothetical protein